MENIRFKRLNSMAITPSRGSEQAAGYDLYAAIEGPITIVPHTTTKIGTGLSFELPNNTFGAIFARSGLATEKGLAPANMVGVCDSDYRGEYIVPLHNYNNEPQTIEPGERIAQLILMPYIPMVFEEVEALNDTQRGDGSFGSTGSK